MARPKPIIQAETLRYQQGGQEYTIPFGPPASLTWLEETASTFVFISDEGSFTAYKARSGSQRGRWYWRAVRWHGGKQYTVHLGASATITLASLHAAAVSLTVQIGKHSRQQTSPPPPVALTAQELLIKKIPLPLEQLVGRQQALQRISSYLQSPTRLLTLRGLGGVGKTVLARRVLYEVQSLFSDGAVFLPLESIRQPGRVLAALAHKLNVRQTESHSLLETLKGVLREKHLLLGLDNFERVLAAAPLLKELLESCPRLKMLVTSRSSLNLEGEKVYHVKPLKVPPPSKALTIGTVEQYPAVKLFLQRAHAVLPDFRLTESNVSAVAQLCQHLEGLPLALLLAAAGLKLFSPQELLAHQGCWLELLQDDRPNVPKRHKTLHAVFATSYEACSLGAQRLFRRLVPFVGGFTFQAVVQVSAYLGEPPAEIRLNFEMLVDASLIETPEPEGEQRRFRLLEPLRAYAQAHLAQSGEQEDVYKAHAAYYLDYAQEAEPLLKSEQDIESSDRLEREHENMLAALEWFLEHCDHQRAQLLAAALECFWYMRGYWNEGRMLLERVITLDYETATVERAKALCAATHLAFMQSDYSQAKAWGDESMRLFRHLHDLPGIFLTYTYLTDLYIESAEYAQALEFAKEGLALARDSESDWQVSYALVMIAAACLYQGDYTSASTYVEECRELSDRKGYRPAVAWCAAILGGVALTKKDYITAHHYFKQAVELFQTLRIPRGIINSLLGLAKASFGQSEYAEACAYYLDFGQEYLLNRRIARWEWTGALCLRGLGEVAAMQGKAVLAAQIWGAAERFAIRLVPFEYMTYPNLVQKVQADLGEEAFEAARMQGLTMSIEQVLQATKRAKLCEKKLPAMEPETNTPSPVLTKRQKEILLLVAKGSKRQQIADSLHITVRTVDSHVENIKQKLKVSTLAEAVHQALLLSLIG